MAADLEQLRQEAENLRKKIRVSDEGVWREGRETRGVGWKPYAHGTWRQWSVAWCCVCWTGWGERWAREGAHMPCCCLEGWEYTQSVMKGQCVYMLCTVLLITQHVHVQPTVYYTGIIVAGNCYLWDACSCLEMYTKMYVITSTQLSIANVGL